MTNEEEKEWMRRTYLRLIHSLFKLLSLLMRLLSGTYICIQSETTGKDDSRTTAGPYATFGPLHQTHMHTELEKVGHTFREKDRHSSPLLASGVSVLASDMPASGEPAWRFDMLHLPHSQFQPESVFEAQRRNPKPSLSVLCVPD